MALVFQNVVSMTIPLVDETGSNSQVQMNFALGDFASLPSLVAAVVAGVPAIEALSSASATGMTLSLPFREDDVTPPQAASRVERRGVWELINTQGRRFSISIPSIAQGFVDENGYIRRLLPQVIAFETFLTGSSACDSRGVEIGGIIDAREVFRASTRNSRPPLRG